MTVIISKYKEKIKERTKREIRRNLSKYFKNSKIEIIDCGFHYHFDFRGRFVIYVIADYFEEVISPIDRINLIRTLLYEFLSYEQIDMLQDINGFSNLEWQERERITNSDNLNVVKGLV